MFKPIYLPTYLAIHLSIYLSIHLIISDICVHIYILYILYIIIPHYILYHIIYILYIYIHIIIYIDISVFQCQSALKAWLTHCFVFRVQPNPWSTVRSFRSLPAAPPASPAPLRLWFWFSLEWNQTHFGIFIRLSDTNKTCTLTKHHRTNVRWDCEIRLFLQQNAATKMDLKQRMLLNRSLGSLDSIFKLESQHSLASEDNEIIDLIRHGDFMLPEQRYWALILFYTGKFLPRT